MEQPQRKPRFGDITDGTLREFTQEDKRVYADYRLVAPKDINDVKLSQNVADTELAYVLEKNTNGKRLEDVFEKLLLIKRGNYKQENNNVKKDFADLVIAIISEHYAEVGATFLKLYNEIVEIKPRTEDLDDMEEDDKNRLYERVNKLNEYIQFENTSVNSSFTMYFIKILKGEVKRVARIHSVSDNGFINFSYWTQVENNLNIGDPFIGYKNNGEPWIVGFKKAENVKTPQDFRPYARMAAGRYYLNSNDQDPKETVQYDNYLYKIKETEVFIYFTEGDSSLFTSLKKDGKRQLSILRDNEDTKKFDYGKYTENEPRQADIYKKIASGEIFNGSSATQSKQEQNPPASSRTPLPQPDALRPGSTSQPADTVSPPRSAEDQNIDKSPPGSQRLPDVGRNPISFGQSSEKVKKEHQDSLKEEDEILRKRPELKEPQNQIESKILEDFQTRYGKLVEDYNQAFTHLKEDMDKSLNKLKDLSNKEDREPQKKSERSSQPKPKFEEPEGFKLFNQAFKEISDRFEPENIMIGNPERRIQVIFGNSEASVFLSEIFYRIDQFDYYVFMTDFFGNYVYPSETTGFKTSGNNLLLDSIPEILRTNNKEFKLSRKDSHEYQKNIYSAKYSDNDSSIEIIYRYDGARAILHHVILSMQH